MLFSIYSNILFDKKISNINEKKKSEGKIQTNNGETPRTISKGKPNSSPSAAEGHSEDYPCAQCEQSLASRFLYHTVPKLKLRDTVWIPTNNNEDFFIICYTEWGMQSDGILHELRRAEIGIRSGTKVFIVPLSCGLGLEQVVSKQKTISSQKLEVSDDEESVSREDESRPKINSYNRFLQSVRARLTVQQIIVSIRSRSLLTFDYVFFCVLASMISALGLLENSTV